MIKKKPTCIAVLINCEQTVPNSKATSTPGSNIIHESIEHLIIGDSPVQGMKENLFHKNTTTKVVQP